MNNAFTLLEVLVTILILGVLLVVGSTALRGARNRAREAVCQSNLRQLALATVALTDEQAGRFPYFEPGRPGEASGPRISDRVFLEKAGLSAGVLACPSDATATSSSAELYWSYDYIPGLHMTLMAMTGETDPVWRVSQDYRNAPGSHPIFADNAARHAGGGGVSGVNVAMFPDCSARAR